ncbi:hypothetical protein AA0116_g12426 [Alternaria tenuissima]|nr:hypothetical protein AA0116_g12426 [Alternaria tenuissima]
MKLITVFMAALGSTILANKDPVDKAPFWHSCNQCGYEWNDCLLRHNPTRSPYPDPFWDAACAEELCNNDDDYLGWWCWHNCYFHQGSCFAYGRMTDKGGKYEDKGFSRGE